MMKFNALSVILLLVCLGLIFYIWNPGRIFNGKTEITTIIRPEGELWFPAKEEWTDQEEMARAEGHIETIRSACNDLSGPLTDTQIDAIQTFFKHRGFITKMDGHKIRTEAIRGYLTSHRDEIEEIKFELRWCVAEENTYNAEHILPDQRDDDDVLCYVHFGFKVTYVLSDGRIIDPTGSRDDRHTRICEWDGD